MILIEDHLKLNFKSELIAKEFDDLVNELNEFYSKPPKPKLSKIIVYALASLIPFHPPNSLIYKPLIQSPLEKYSLTPTQIDAIKRGSDWARLREPVNLSQGDVDKKYVNELIDKMYDSYKENYIKTKK